MTETITTYHNDGETEVTTPIDDKHVTGIRIGNQIYLVSLGDINDLLKNKQHAE